MNNLEFRTARRALGLTQEELANKIGVDSRTVQRYEKGNYLRKRFVIPPRAEIIINFLLKEKNEKSFFKNEPAGDVCQPAEGMNEKI